MFLNIIGILLCTYIMVSVEAENCLNPTPVCAFKPGVGTRNFPDECFARKEDAWPFRRGTCKNNSGEDEKCPNPSPMCAFKPGVGTRNFPDACSARTQGFWPFSPGTCKNRTKYWNHGSSRTFKPDIVDSKEPLSSRRYFDKYHSKEVLGDLLRPREPCGKFCQEIKEISVALGSLTSTSGANGRKGPLRVPADPNRSKIFSLTGRTSFSRKPCNCPKNRWYTFGCDGKRYLNSCEARCRSKGVRRNGRCIPAYTK